MPNAQQQFGKMADLVPNSTAVLRLNFCAKLNICASISATSPSCKPLCVSIKDITLHIRYAENEIE